MRSRFLSSAAFSGLAALIAAGAQAQMIEIPTDSGPRGRGSIEERAPAQRMQRDEDRRGERSRRSRDMTQDVEDDRPRSRNLEQREPRRPQRAQTMDEERGARRRGNETEQAPDARRPTGRAEQNDQRRTTSGARNAPTQAQQDQQQRNAPTQAQQPQDQRRGQAQDQRSLPNNRGVTQDQTPGSGSQPTGQARGETDANVQAQINVAPDHARRIHDTLIRSGERTNVRVDVNIGRPIAQSVRVRPLPPDLIAVSPELRGYDYVVVDEEIVIVEPRSRRVVEVIGPGGRMASARGAAPIAPQQARGAASTDMPTGSIQSGGAAASLTLTTSDRERIRRAILGARSAPRLDIATGVQLPTTIEIGAVPDDIVAIAPTLKGYQYFVTGERIVFVDPSSHAIVDIVQ